MVNKNERTIEVVHQEYSQTCAKAGHTQYQVETLKKELDILNAQLRDLNLEAAALNAKQTETKQTEASVAEPAAKTE